MIRLFIYFLALSAPLLSASCIQGHADSASTAGCDSYGVAAPERVVDQAAGVPCPARHDLDFFVPVDIPDSVFERMRGVSIHDFCPVGRDDLCYIRVKYVDFDDRERVGEIVCNKAISADLADIFSRLYDNRYPLAEVSLVDKYGGDDNESMRHNNSSCFNCRRTSGGGRLSLHAYGMAVDINPLMNPYVRAKANGRVIIEPAEGAPYTKRRPLRRGMIDRDDLCCKLFVAHGFRWGGGWRGSIKDYQHFDKKP